MLRVGSTLRGDRIEASDDNIGTVADFLFEDKSWAVRWLVVDTGSWLTGRKVLVHPSSIGKIDDIERVIRVGLTKARIEDSPSLLLDQPVSRQMESSLFDYYGWDPPGGPQWGGSRLERGTMDPPATPSPYVDAAMDDAAGFRAHLDHQDPDLRSMIAVTGYHCQATDGAIGHVKDFLIDDATWCIRYLIVDTRNWWPGQSVLLPPPSVKSIDWSESRIELNVTRGQVKASPPWNPVDVVDRAYEDRLYQHYNWPGYGW